MTQRIAGPYRLLLGALLVAAGGLLALLPQAVRGDTVAALAVVPPSSAVPLGQGTFQVRVAVQDVQNLGAWEFGLNYNPDVLQFQSVAPLDSFFNPPGRACHTADVTGSSFWFGCNTLAGLEHPGVDGSGDLALITFQIRAAGESPLVFFRVGLAVPEGSGIPADGLNGTVVVLAPGQSTPTALPPTPTKVPGALTPTPPAGATHDPTQIADATAAARTPGPGGATGPGADGEGRTNQGEVRPPDTGDPARTASGASASAGRGGSGDFPRAGTGAASTRDTWGKVLGGILAALGGALVLSALYRLGGTEPDQG